MAARLALPTTALVALIFVLGGCGAESSVAPPLPTGPAPVVPPPVRFELEIPDWLGGDRLSRTREVTAPVEGTFTLRVAWNPMTFDGTMKMTLGDRSLPDRATNCSPIVGHLDVQAGETRHVTVSSEDSPFSDTGIYSTAYVLTVTFEERRPDLPRGPSPPSTPQTGVLAEISDTYWGGSSRPYSVTVPADGTLVGRLAWDAARRDAARLGLGLGNIWFEPSPPAWAPVVGRIPVQAGQTCRVDVEEAIAIWDYGFDAPFVLTFSLE